MEAKKILEFGLDNLMSFQALRDYACAYNLERVCVAADAAVCYIIGRFGRYSYDSRFKVPTVLDLESLDYYRGCAIIAIERLVRDYGLNTGEVPDTGGETVLSLVKNLSKFL